MKLTWKEQVLLMNFRLASEKDKQQSSNLQKPWTSVINCPVNLI